MKVTTLLLATLLSFFLPLSTIAGERTETPAPSAECVVLLHGLWRTELSMKALQWKLTDAGYTVVNVTYPSLSHPIEELAVMAVEEGVAECQALKLEPIHFVTHSLGGILVRQYLLNHNIPGLHRVVMLGPPNQGSQAADYVHSVSALRPFSPEAIEQLGTGEESIPRQLGPVTFELGIIAGTSSRSVDLPGAPEGASDGTVAVAETIVPGMLDLLEMPVGHTFMMWDESVLEQVVYFLRHGAFKRPLPVKAAS